MKSKDTEQSGKSTEHDQRRLPHLALLPTDFFTSSSPFLEAERFVMDVLVVNAKH